MLKKALLVLYEIEPNKGSDPGLGWLLGSALSQYYETTILLDNASRNLFTKEQFHTSFSTNTKIHFTNFSLINFLNKYDFTRTNLILTNIRFILWHMLCVLELRGLDKASNFDFIWGISIPKATLPTCAAFINKPFIWGPMGAVDKRPPNFSYSSRFLPWLSAKFRELFIRIAFLNPFLIYCIRKSSIVFCTTNETYTLMKKYGAKNPVLQTHTGYESSKITYYKRELNNEPLKLIFSCRLLEWKGAHLALQVIKNLKVPVTLDIIGDGPEATFLKTQANNSNILDRVNFIKKMNQSEYFSCLKNYHLRIHPSLHATSDLTIAESLANGLPIIALNWAGMTLNFPQNYPLLVEPKSEDYFVKKSCEIIESIYKSEINLSHISQLGREHAEKNLRWEALASTLNVSINNYLKET